MAFIEVKDLSFTYPSTQDQVLRGIDLSIEKGEYLAVLGANGSGKSTLVRHFNGLLTASSGAVRVGGIDPSRSTELGALRRLVSMVFQSPNDQIVGTETDLDIAFGPENLGLSSQEIGRRVDHCLSRLGLETERHSPINLLSPGKQQLLALADALAMEAECIILDEANSMVAPEARASIMAELDRLRSSGRTIINVTHSMEEASRADRVLVLASGRLVFDGRPDSLFAKSECRAWGLALPQGLALKGLLKPFWDLSPERLLPPDLRPEPEEFAASILARSDRDGALEIRPEGRPASRPSQAALVFENVSFAYPLPGGGSIQALSGVSFKAYRGELTAIVGPAGSGKSSVLQLANALLLPDSGRVACLGMDTLGRRLDAAALRRRAGLCLQRAETALFEDFAGDDVAYGPRFSGISGPELRTRVKDAMEAMGLDYALFRDRHPRSLSGGERRRLAIAGILSLDPELYLFDEPTSSMDPQSDAHTLALMRSLKERGKSVVFTTHDMEEAAIADRVLVFSGGRLVFDGEPEKLFYHRKPEDWGLDRPFAVKVAMLLPPVLRASLGQPLCAEEFAKKLCQVRGLRIDHVPALAAEAKAAPEDGKPWIELPLPELGRKKRKNPFDLRSGISLGQHLKIDSPIQRLTPRMKYLGLFCLMIPALSSRTVWAPLACLAIALALAASARVRIGYLLKSLPSVIPIMLIYLVLQFLTGSASDPAPLRAGPFSLSWLEMSASLSVFLKLIALMCALGLFSAVTSMSQIIHGVEDFLSPFKRLGLRVSDAALLVGITFRFVPIMAEEAETILKAQASRGSPGYSGGALRRARTAASIVVPLMVRALSRSEILAQAMEARCYPSDAPSRYVVYPPHRRRALIYGCCLAIGSLLFLLAVLAR
jgi:energy-coupling factor transporter ATP-binding protein EcfA2/energy-coupling factor transporter transmembrane protein EcfT